MRYRSVMLFGAMLCSMGAQAVPATFELSTNQLMLPLVAVDKQSAWSDVKVTGGKFTQLQTGMAVRGDSRPEFDSASGLLMMPQLDVLKNGVVTDSLRGVGVTFLGADSVLPSRQAERKDLFSLSGWDLQLPDLRADGSLDSVFLSDSVPASVTPCMTFDGAGLVFQAPSVAGGHSEGSYPRCELRERWANPVLQTSKTAGWYPTQGGTFGASLAVRRVSPLSNHATVAQIFANGLDSFVMLKLKTDAEKPYLILQYRPDPAGAVAKPVTLINNVELNQAVAFTLRISQVDQAAPCQLEVTVNGAVTSYPLSSAWGSKQMYFKLGAYHDLSSAGLSRAATANDITEVKVYSFSASHP